jgi:hypothetical protein
MQPVAQSDSCIRKPEEWAKMMAELEEEKRQREKSREEQFFMVTA